MLNPIPQKLGKYEVHGQISRGSMGIVYLGYDPYADRQVAIKVALSESLDDPDLGPRYRKLFFNEAHAAGMLTHPNIIHVHDAGVDGNNCYIVMEYVAGGKTLKDYCRIENLLPVEKVVEIIFKCATALDYAHRQGVVHRDIKPSNILLTEDHDIKIGDFSIAHIIKGDSTETQPLGIIGSPRYMSPEQLREDFADSQTDLFSLGIVMFELLTGRHPFYAENFSRLVNKVLSEDPPPMRGYRSELPEALERIVCRALDKDLARRYKTGLDLASELSRNFGTLEGPKEEISNQEQFNAISCLDFFSGFPNVELWEILRASSWHSHDAGEQIIAEGELDDCFYIIVSGSVAVRKNGRTIRSLGEGDCFGEMGYLARTKRTATIVAEENASLLKINSTIISQVSLNCQVRFLKVFLRTMIHRLSATTERVSEQI